MAHAIQNMPTNDAVIRSSRQGSTHSALYMVLFGVVLVVHGGVEYRNSGVIGVLPVLGLISLAYGAANLFRSSRLPAIPRHPPGHCQKCGYNMAGSASGRCPECGAQ